MSKKFASVKRGTRPKTTASEPDVSVADKAPLRDSRRLSIGGRSSSRNLYSDSTKLTDWEAWNPDSAKYSFGQRPRKSGRQFVSSQLHLIGGKRGAWKKLL